MVSKKSAKIKKTAHTPKIFREILRYLFFAFFVAGLGFFSWKIRPLVRSYSQARTGA